MNQVDDMQELARIFLTTTAGRGGFECGDTAGPEGGFGREKLQRCIDAGFAMRTGRDVPNQLGGSWPEVSVTAAGALAIVKSGMLHMGGYLAPGRAVGTADGSYGEVEFDALTGAVLGPIYGDDESMAPMRIDVAEWRETYPGEDISDATHDILDLGYTSFGGSVEKADEEWRAEFRVPPGERRRIM